MVMVLMIYGRGERRVTVPLRLNVIVSAPAALFARLIAWRRVQLSPTPQLDGEPRVSARLSTIKAAAWALDWGMKAIDKRDISNRNRNNLEVTRMVFSSVRPKYSSRF